MLNRIIAAGRLTRDVEVKQLQSGKSVANFTIACERDSKGADGNKQTDFLDVVTFGSSADFCANYTGKGLMLVVDGRLQIRKWEDKDGNKRSSAEIVAYSVYPMEWRKGDAYEPKEEAVPDLGDSDLPF